VDGVRPAFDSVEEIAACHVEQIVRFQPKGRYFLGGWSFGGIVAYEIACQLRERGNEVGFLAILDAGFLYSFGVLRTIFSDRAIPLFHLAAETTDTLLEQMREAGVRAQLIPEMATEQMAQQIANVFGKNVEALWNYRPRPYTGRGTLIRARERFVDVRVRRDPSQEWSELCSEGVEEVSTPGDHLTMIQPPHVAALSRRLRRCLRHARLYPTASPSQQKAILSARDGASDS
jgi:thioesterase domain-containing protein